MFSVVLFFFSSPTVSCQANQKHTHSWQHVHKWDMLTWCASINFDPVTPVSQCAHHLLYLSSITLLVYLHSSYSFYFLPPHKLIPFFLSPYIIYFFHFLFHPVFNPLLSLPSFFFPPPLQIIHFLFLHSSYLCLFLLLQPLLSNSIPLFLIHFITSVLLLPSFFYHSIPFFLPPLPSHQTLSIFLFHLTSVLPCFLCYNSAFFLAFSFLLAPILFTVLCNSLEPPLISLFCLQEPRLSCNFWSGFELWMFLGKPGEPKVFWH